MKNILRYLEDYNPYFLKFRSAISEGVGKIGAKSAHFDAVIADYCAFIKVRTRMAFHIFSFTPATPKPYRTFSTSRMILR